MKGREYQRSMGSDWWLRSRPYFLFMLREFTALFVGGYAIFLLVLLSFARQGPQSLGRFMALLSHPLSISLHLVTLAMVIYHSVTWFHSAPKVVTLWRGEHPVASGWIIALQYAAWGLISLLIAGTVLRSAGG